MDDQQPGRIPSWKCFWSRRSKWLGTSKRERKEPNVNGRPARGQPRRPSWQTKRAVFWPTANSEWPERLTTDPASFAAVELEVHEQTRRQADLYVAGLLAKASKQAQTRPHIDEVIKAAEAPLRPVEKKDAPWLCGLLEDWRSR